MTSYNIYHTRIDPLIRVIKQSVDRIKSSRIAHPAIDSITYSGASVLFKLLRYPGREMNFYFLSTGRCGTRFFARVLDTATNAVVLHEPSPHLQNDMSELAPLYIINKCDFQRATVKDYSSLKLKILLHQTIRSQIYGETFHKLFPFGHILYKYLGPSKLRLVHLIRDPVTCCRSYLKVERDNGGIGRTHLPSALIEGRNAAEQVANLWNNINEMIQYEFKIIDNPTICKTVRLEDTDLDSIRELFEFLQLDGFNEREIARLMNDTSQDVRHSHIRKSIRRDATYDELETVARICAPLAAEFGYQHF